MNETKKWYQSKTVWGSVVTIAAAVAGVFGYGIDADTQGRIVENISSVIAAVGGLFALFGRLVADKKIS